MNALDLAKLATSSDGLEYSLTYLVREQQPPLYHLRIRGGRVGRADPINQSGALSPADLRASLLQLCGALNVEGIMGSGTPTPDLSGISLAAIADQRDKDVATLEEQLEAKHAAYEADVAELKTAIASTRLEARECRRAADRLARLTIGGGGASRRPRSSGGRADKGPGLEEQILAAVGEKGEIEIDALASRLQRDRTTIAACVGRLSSPSRRQVVRDGDTIRIGKRGKGA